MSKAIISVFLVMSAMISIAQITVINPGFEDTPSDATVPQGWSACAWLTTPDILPGYWGVYNEPDEGDTYAGIITRENGTFESFGQRLSAPVLPETCYQMSIKLAHSMVYAGYGRPIKLRVWLSNELCGESQLIFTSPLIDHEEWKTYTIPFTPTKKGQYIMFEAYIKDGKFNHKGNVLMDNMSSIIACLKA